MDVRKKLKKYGNSAVIVFTKEELEAYNLEIKDIIGLSFYPIHPTIKEREMVKNGVQKR